LRLILQQPSFPLRRLLAEINECGEREGGCWEPRGRLVSLMTVAAVLPATAAAIYQALENAMPNLVTWSIIIAIAFGTAIILAFALHLIG
jgi:hypothetical protein